MRVIYENELTPTRHTMSTVLDLDQDGMDDATALPVGPWPTSTENVQFQRVV